MKIKNLIRLIISILLLGRSAMSFGSSQTEVLYIPFDTEFVVPVTIENIGERAWGRKKITSKNLDEIFLQKSRKCKKKQEPLRTDIRVRLKNESGVVIYIAREKFFFSEKNICSFGKIESQIISDIKKVFKDIKAPR